MDEADAARFFGAEALAGQRVAPYLARTDGVEQVCYMLEGTALAEIGGERCEMKPGDVCYFPAGEMHKFTATSDTPVKVLVIYSPPYGESPDKVIRSRDAAHS